MTNLVHFIICHEDHYGDEDSETFTFWLKKL